MSNKLLNICSCAIFVQASEIQMNSWRNVCYEAPVCVYVNVYIVWVQGPGGRGL